MAQRNVLTRTASAFLTSTLVVCSAGTMQASTIYDFWHLDRSWGLAYFDGREHGIPGQAQGEGEAAAAPRAYRIEVSADGGAGQGRTGTELSPSFSDGSSRGSAAAASAAAAASGDGVYSLDQTYSDVNYSADGGGDSDAAAARQTRIAISSAPGASLQLEGMNSGNGAGNGADSLLICGDAECLALQNGNLNRSNGGNGAAGYGSVSESDLVMVASLAEPVAMVDAPEPATFLPLGAGLVIFGAMKRKKKQQVATAAAAK